MLLYLFLVFIVSMIFIDTYDFTLSHRILHIMSNKQQM